MRSSMPNVVITLILAFNVVMVILFFMLKIHKHTVDKADRANRELLSEHESKEQSTHEQ